MSPVLLNGRRLGVERNGSFTAVGFAHPARNAVCQSTQAKVRHAL
jgi:hypothetical protein